MISMLIRYDAAARRGSDVGISRHYRIQAPVAGFPRNTFVEDVQDAVQPHAVADRTAALAFG